MLLEASLRRWRKEKKRVISAITAMLAGGGKAGKKQAALFWKKGQKTFGPCRRLFQHLPTGSKSFCFLQ